MSDSVSQELIGTTVDDVVVRLPKTSSIGMSVDQARACLADDHVHMVLLTESARLMGTLVMADLGTDVDGTEMALPYSRMSGRTIPAGTSAAEARKLLLSQEQRRLAVVGDAGELVGLLCLKRHLRGFCSDADVAARAAERTP